MFIDISICWPFCALRQVRFVSTITCACLQRYTGRWAQSCLSRQLVRLACSAFSTQVTILRLFFPFFVQLHRPFTQKLNAQRDVIWHVFEERGVTVFDWCLSARIVRVPPTVAIARVKYVRVGGGYFCVWCMTQELGVLTVGGLHASAHRAWVPSRWPDHVRTCLAGDTHRA